MVEAQLGPALSIRGLSKTFAGVPAVKNVSFDIARGSIHCLVGGNGSGKSTTIKILAGVHQADAGEVEINGSTLDARDISPATAREVGLRFVHQQQSTFADLTVAENLAIGHGFEGRRGRIHWRALRRRAQVELDRFGIEASPDSAMRDLRPATQAMVAIARALQGPDQVSDRVLVLDEPTASLPAQEVSVLLDALKSYAASGESILFVTHRLTEVLEVADEVTAFRDGVSVATVDGGTLDHDKLAELIIGRKIDELLPSPPAAPAEQIRPVLRVRSLVGGPVRGVDLEVKPGEIVGIAGLLGSGRSALLRMLFGAGSVEAGQIELDGAVTSFRGPAAAMAAGVALVPEDRRREAVFPHMSVEENLSISTPWEYFKGWIHRKDERTATFELIRQFQIKTASPDAPLLTLSGGNQQKVIMARWMRRLPRLLLLDEPTQGVDVGSRAEIWQLVRSALALGTGVLVVSSDMEELPHVCDRVLVLRDGRVASELSGSDLTEQRLEQALLTQVAAP